MDAGSTTQRDTSRLRLLASQCLQRADALTAQALFLEGMRQDPGSAACWTGWGAALLQRGHVAQAIAALEQALRLDAGEPLLLETLSDAYHSASRFSDSLEVARQLIALGRDSQALQLRIASAELNLRLFDAASERLHTLNASLESDSPLASSVRYTPYPLLLRVGEWARGWDAFEERFMHGGHDAMTCYPHRFTQWQGQDIPTANLLVHREQGYGDMIMFASVLPELQRAAGKLVVSLPFALLRLFAHSFPNAHCFQSRVVEGQALLCDQDWLAEAPAIDYQVPFCSLGAVKRRDAASFGAPAAYLRPDQPTAHRFAQMLDVMRTDGGKRMAVGLAWAARRMVHTGGAKADGLNKSVPSEALEVLAELTGIQWVSLMKPDATSPSEILPSALQALDFSWAVRDFMDTAALIAQLDIVIAVDSAVAHLAAAMGKETWLLLRWNPDWRWDHEGRSNPWYQNVRLFRQQAPGDWSAPLQAVAAALAMRTSRQTDANSDVTEPVIIEPSVIRKVRHG